MPDATPPSARVAPLFALLPFLRPYAGRWALAFAALVTAAGATLALPVTFKYLIDRGFAGGNRAHIDRYFLALFVVSPVLAGATPVAQAEAAEPLPARGDGIRLDNVGFSYPSRPGTVALSGISLNVRPGEHVALVGPSGAGKTTLFQLLLRFYDPQAGSILINGVPTRDVPLAELRPDIGVVMQESVIFSGSVLDNIRYGHPRSHSRASPAGRRNGRATGFIEELPQCYDTFLGERGVRLSGGQPQPSRSPARS